MTRHRFLCGHFFLKMLNFEFIINDLSEHKFIEELMYVIHILYQIYLSLDECANSLLYSVLYITINNFSFSRFIQ
jgi:hypothetical protein